MSENAALFEYEKVSVLLFFAFSNVKISYFIIFSLHSCCCFAYCCMNSGVDPRNLWLWFNKAQWDAASRRWSFVSLKMFSEFERSFSSFLCELILFCSHFPSIFRESQHKFNFWVSQRKILQFFLFSSLLFSLPQYSNILHAYLTQVKRKNEKEKKNLQK